MLEDDRSSPMDLQEDDILSCLESGMSHFNFIEFLVVCSCVILVAFLLTEILDWSQLFSCAEFQNLNQKACHNFGYTSQNGPHTWQGLYPDCKGENQSPINILTGQAIVLNSSDELVWVNYETAPETMNITNDGHTVLLTGTWVEKPRLCGGPLGDGEYEFHSIMFHWGPCDTEGSEHTLDNDQYAMELQMIHVKKGYSCPFDATMAGEKEAIAIIAFLFEIAPVDNPLLDQVVNNIFRITQPGTTASINPFPLNWIYPSFASNFYTYFGSLTQPPCCEAVIWIIQPEGLAVSARQLNQFRTLYSEDGRMCSNMRPVQLLNNRDIFYYE